MIIEPEINVTVGLGRCKQSPYNLKGRLCLGPPLVSWTLTRMGLAQIWCFSTSSSTSHFSFFHISWKVHVKSQWICRLHGVVFNACNPSIQLLNVVVYSEDVRQRPSILGRWWTRWWNSRAKGGRKCEREVCTFILRLFFYEPIECLGQEDEDRENVEPGPCWSLKIV